MKSLLMAALAALLLLGQGCKDKPKEVSTIARGQAAQDVSEAEFAMQIRDYTRAEGLLDKAVQLDPEIARYWLQLGAARKKLNNTSGAKKAYERARELLKAEYRRDKSSPAPLFAEIEVCILLGKPSDAKSVSEQMVKNHSEDIDVKNFVANHVLEKLLVDPNLKAMAL